MQQRSRSTRWKILTGLAAVAILGGTRLALGSDHQDTPDVEANPKQDMTDVYAFPEPDRGADRAGDELSRLSHPCRCGGRPFVRSGSALPVQDRLRR